MAGSDTPDLFATLLAHPDRIDPRTLAAVTPLELVRIAEEQKIVPLASRALDAIDASAPAAMAMHASAAAWALREHAERRAIRAFLDAARGAPFLFFKGASTAHTLYATPAMRMREDWDVLAAPGAEEAIRAALGAAGFALDRSVKPGRIRMRQQAFRCPVPGSECIVDLHLRALNPPSLSERISYEDLDRRGIPLPSLHSSARGLADDAALVVACAHRLAHHSGEPRLSWDYDVLLLARRLDAASASLAAALADRWGVGAFVAAELRRVTSRFDAPLTPPLAGLLTALDAAPPDAYARPNRSRAREFFLDWRSLRGSDRFALIRETLAPDPSFVRQAARSRLPLPLLYALRIVRGARAWFTRS